MLEEYLGQGSVWGVCSALFVFGNWMIPGIYDHRIMFSIATVALGWGGGGCGERGLNADIIRH